jgi:hypothetical protein
MKENTGKPGKAAANTGPAIEARLSAARYLFTDLSILFIERGILTPE